MGSPQGALMQGEVTPDMEFVSNEDAARGKRANQRVDERTGLLQWKVLASDPSASKERDASVTVVMLAEVQPVPPEAVEVVPGMRVRPVEFTDITVEPRVMGCTVRAKGITAPGQRFRPVGPGAAGKVSVTLGMGLWWLGWARWSVWVRNMALSVRQTDTVAIAQCATRCVTSIPRGSRARRRIGTSARSIGNRRGTVGTGRGVDAAAPCGVAGNGHRCRPRLSRITTACRTPGARDRRLLKRPIRRSRWTRSSSDHQRPGKFAAHGIREGRACTSTDDPVQSRRRRD